MKNTAQNTRVSNRWGRRLPLRHEIELRAVNGDWVAANLEDVSLSGALVRTGLALRPYTQVTVLIPGIAEPVAGFVVRAADGKVGIEWAEPAPHVVTFLRTMGSGEADRAHLEIRRPRPVSLNWHVVARGARDMLMRHRS